MASLSNDLEGLSLNLPDVVAEAAVAASAVASNTKKSVRNRRGRRGGNRGQKSTSAASEAATIKPEATSAVKVEDELLGAGACALVHDDQRVPDISLPNLEDFIEVSSDEEEKTVEDEKSSLAEIVAADPLPKVQETSRKSGGGRSRHAVDNFFFVSFHSIFF